MLPIALAVGVSIAYLISTRYYSSSVQQLMICLHLSLSFTVQKMVLYISIKMDGGTNSYKVLYIIQRHFNHAHALQTAVLSLTSDIGDREPAFGPTAEVISSSACHHIQARIRCRTNTQYSAWVSEATMRWHNNICTAPSAVAHPRKCVAARGNDVASEVNVLSCMEYRALGVGADNRSNTCTII